MRKRQNDNMKVENDDDWRAKKQYFIDRFRPFLNAN